MTELTTEDIDQLLGWYGCLVQEGQEDEDDKALREKLQRIYDERTNS
jgi:hypothetical protein